jgi:hypothetical protein
MRNKMVNQQIQQQQNRNLPQQRLGSASQQLAGGPEVRPMTSNRGAGFQKTDAKKPNFDPLNLNNKGPAPALVKKTETTPEET